MLAHHHGKKVVTPSHAFSLSPVQIASLESQVSTYAYDVKKLDRALAAESQEKQALLASHNGLLDKYNALKKEAVKLEQFRKVGRFSGMHFCNSYPPLPLRKY